MVEGTRTTAGTHRPAAASQRGMSPFDPRQLKASVDEPTRELDLVEYKAALKRTRTLGGGDTQMPLMDLRILPPGATETLHENGFTKVFTYNGDPLQTSFSAKHAGENRAQLRAAQESTARELRAEGVSEAKIQELLMPTEIHQGNMFVPLADGMIAALPFFRVIFGKDGQGGIRMHHAVTLDEVIALAFTMGKKHAITGQLRSGAKGGIGAGFLLDAQGAQVLKDGIPVELDLQSFLTPEMQERVGYHYRNAFGRNWGRDGAAPDVQTGGPHFVRGFVQRHQELTGHSAPWVATGKAVDGDNPAGGSKFRTEATGEGVIFVNHLALEQLGIPVKGSTVAVQGSGNVGWHAIAAAVRSEQKVQYISDRDGGLFIPEGVTAAMLKPLSDFIKAHGTVEGFQAEGVFAFNKDDILSREVDTLIPAALGGVIDGEVARTVRAKVVIEAANTPVVGNGRQVLSERGIMSVPDLLANAGGTVDSVVGEQAQNISGVVVDAKTESERMKDKLLKAFAKAMAVYPRAGAMDAAVERAAGLELVRRRREATSTNGVSFP